MKKLIIIILFLGFGILTGCGKSTEINRKIGIQKSDSQQTTNTNNTITFKTEYEAFNDGQHPHLKVPENLDIHILDFSGTQALLESGSGILFFGFPTCPWCRHLLPELFVAMQASGIKPLYYFNPKDLRDEKVLENGTIITKKPTSPEYEWLLEKLDKILPVYEGLNDNKIKRLYVPTLLIIKDGEIINHHFNTIDEQKDPYIPLTPTQKIKLQNLLKTAITPLQNGTCGIPGIGETPKYSC